MSPPQWEYISPLAGRGFRRAPPHTLDEPIPSLRYKLMFVSF
jgi:hypothetical protein